MKLHIHTLALVAILGTAPLTFAKTDNTNTSIKEVKKETKDFLQTLGSYSADKKNEALKTAQDGLKKLDKRVDTLESSVDKNWDKMSKNARKEARENLKVIRKQRNQVAEWYGGMKSSSVNAWENMKKGFANAYQSLENAWEKSEKEFSSEK